MKVTFVQPEKKDNKFSFNDLKVGDVFTIADPRASKVTTFMKIKPGKNYSSPLDVINLDTGEVSVFTDTKKEIISVDQLFVYKVNAEMTIKLD
ncbi:MAG: hypothetical protein EBU90_18395 [Proteobacteria bacterium]|nr:hypothetical protein [Pseudomonadota bacterium]NBP13042.1 hypothetical protein [bacterium]